MTSDQTKKRIAILGAGPSGLFMFKALLDSGLDNIEIHIFERKQQVGAGMPYSTEGANDEHVTNVSDNEIPLIVTSIQDWAKTLDQHTLDRFRIDPVNFNPYRVLPRLLFGQYLSDQFQLLLKKAKTENIEVHLRTHYEVLDIIDQPNAAEVTVKVSDLGNLTFDHVIICTGHQWPKPHEGKIPGYFDSPYPPTKLQATLNHPIAVRGSSLTAIDAIRTLARYHGKYEKKDGKLIFTTNENADQFRIVMHSRNGLLPAVRFHLEDSHLENDSLLTDLQLAQHMASNNGFLSLDYIFENDFKEIIKGKDDKFYDKIKDFNLEGFVSYIMTFRENVDAFDLLRAEYIEAEKSIKRRQSIFWKEMLGVLSFALNYPAKYLSAEDMLRLKEVLSPLISIVIAYVPQSSCEELLALHDSGVLSIVTVGSESEVEPITTGGIIYQYNDDSGNKVEKFYKTFVDCIGQPHLSPSQFPFQSLITQRTISAAKLKFSSDEAGEKELKNGNKHVELDKQGDYWLNVPGIAINDSFQVVDSYGAYNSRIYMMAVPYMGGFNPDYSGLDFCQEASSRIAKSIGGEVTALKAIV